MAVTSGFTFTEACYNTTPDASIQVGDTGGSPSSVPEIDPASAGSVLSLVMKVVAQLVPNLPRNQKYWVVMMHRPLDEIIASQKKMLDRLGKEGGRITDDALKATFARQVSQVRSLLVYLRKEGVLDVLDVKYHDVLEDPVAVVERLAAFLGEGFYADRAAAAVDPSLRHERA